MTDVAPIPAEAASAPSELSKPVNVTTSTTFESVPIAPPNKIFNLAALYKKDENRSKLNLGVGAFRDDEGNPVVMTVVQEVEEEMARDIAAGKLNHEYPPMGGSQGLVKAAARLALGEDSKRLTEGLVQGVQALSGTGALRLAAEFISRFHDNLEVYVTNPTWANHPAIFREAGCQPKKLTYYNDATLGLDIEGLLSDLEACPEQSVVVLHACAHNPTGVDPSHDEWKQIAAICQQRNLLTIFDCAYLGFVSGDPDQDAFAMRYWDSIGLNYFICMSFSKNFGLYSERCGVVMYIGNSTRESDAVVSQLKVIGRPIWSVPPMHGATIVERILTDSDLTKKWRYELQTQAKRILHMRKLLHEGLSQRDPAHNWDHIIKQSGMFTYTGLSSDQCQELINEYAIYLLDTGRINVSGIPLDRVDYLVESICSVVAPDAEEDDEEEEDSEGGAEKPSKL